MNNGTGTTFKPGSMGSIKDLLRKANESKNDTKSWQGGERGRVGGESPPVEESVHNETVLKDGKEDATANKECEKATQTQTAVPPSTPKQETTVEQPKPNKPKDNVQPKQKAKIATTVTRQPKKDSFKEIEQEIDNFDYQTERGNRHWVFLPSDVTATLYYAYGEKRISAVISTILRKHIRTYKEEMRQSIAEKSNLFSEQED